MFGLNIAYSIILKFEAKTDIINRISINWLNDVNTLGNPNRDRYCKGPIGFEKTNN